MLLTNFNLTDLRFQKLTQFNSDIQYYQIMEI